MLAAGSRRIPACELESDRYARPAVRDGTMRVTAAGRSANAPADGGLGGVPDGQHSSRQTGDESASYLSCVAGCIEASDRIPAEREGARGYWRHYGRGCLDIMRSGPGGCGQADGRIGMRRSEVRDRMYRALNRDRRRVLLLRRCEERGERLRGRQPGTLRTVAGKSGWPESLTPAAASVRYTEGPE